MFNPTQPSSEDGGTDPKRRRIARACDMCRKKKIKCDGKLPSCTHCVNYKTECVFTLVEKKRNPPKGAKYIEGLENRLGRMESLLKLSGLLPEGDEQTDLGDLERRLQESAGSSQRAVSNMGRSSSESARGTPCSSSIQSATNSPQNMRNEEEVEALSDQMCSLVTNNCGETRFIGSSSGFSIFSPKGIQWVNEKTGDSSFQKMIQDATSSKNGQRPFDMWKPDVFGEIFDQRGKNPLPPKETARLLVQDFFGGFNVLFPLFHQATFEELFEKQYSDNPPPDSGWYAAFNILLAIACRLRISHTPDGAARETTIGSHIQEAWRYFQNAATVLTELLLRNTDLLSIQAILGMALFMQGTANPQPSYFLIAAAVRIATSIGMHRRGNSFGLSAFEVEQRRRIFWILYLLDKDMALRSGRPPCINDDDCNVELPDENPADGIGDVPLRKGKGKFNLFRTMACFAVIESKVYMQLYSARAGKQSDGELLNTIGQLDKELEEWKDAVPAEFRPLAENEMLITEQGPIVMHVVVLHFAYYNCLTTIHRMSIHHGYWTSRLSNYAIAGLSARPLNPRVFSSAALCVSAARASIHLIKYLDPKDYPCIWLVMYYPVSSLVTLFANILQNPQDPRARSDLRLMNVVMEFLHTVLETDELDESSAKYEDGSVNRMLTVCGEFQRISRLVLDKAEKENLGRKKRKPEDQLPRQRQDQPPPNPYNSRPRLSHSQPATPDTHAPTPMGFMNGIDVNPQVHLFTNDLTQPFSPANSMSWLNDIGSPGGPSPVTPTLTSESLQHIPMVSTNSFEQPFVPQDLWQMPMTFEWDWADVNGNGQMPWDPSAGH
ncbi:fungal-specific transcription factor domain-containing protein [Geopyxis carbonaria]|nr:fungal-specific transcription factor domain-containing protein [Geopyxis carbonaria]